MSDSKNIQTIHGRMGTLLSYLETPVLIVSGAYKTAYVNPAFESAFTVKFREVLGKDLSVFLPPSAAESLVENGEEVKTADRAARFILRDLSRYFSVGVSPIHDDDNRITGLVYSITDITKERQLEQVKADFISTLLNDLRAPVAEMVDIFNGVRAGVDDPDKFYSMIDAGAQQSKSVMDRLEQLLNITDSISGDLRLSKSSNNPVMLTSSAVTAVKNVAKKNDVVVVYTPQKTAPEWKCDRDKILQAIIYVLSEQISAAGDKGVVSVGVETATDDAKRTRLFIGAAQPNRTLDRDDFPEFFVEPPESGRADPTGVAIAKIVKAHGGTLSLVGVEKRGCAITLSFPL